MPHSLEVSTPGDREVRVSRVFDAPRSPIFDCHTVPELVQRWLLGPPGWTMPVCEIDLRVGGRYRYVWRSEEDGSEFGLRGEYLEIDAPGRIVHTERFEGGGEEAEGGDSFCTLELTEEGGRTTLTYTMRYPSRKVRDHLLESGMTDGMGMSYDRMEQVMNIQPVS
jgi:uncharacterized protein YndB with AHSA1/START domain